MKPKINLSILLVTVLALIAFSCTNHEEVVGTKDPLPSWNEGVSKKSIIDFVTKTTTQGNTDFVPVADRIACFDNDGTL